MRQAPGILFANERGEGFGHVNRLLAIARHFRDHRLVFVVPDPALTGPAIALALGSSVAVRSCDAWEAVAPEGASSWPAKTLADTLRGFGFADPPRLARAVSIWRALLDDADPDLVVSDFAPALRIAVAGRIPNVVIGSGFTVPPATAPLPGMHAANRAVSDESLANERAILDAVNVTRLALGRPAFARVADLLHGDDTFAASLPILDPYRELRTTPARQPFNIPAIETGPPFERRTGPHVFGYIDGDFPGVNPILTALNGLSRPSQLYLRNVDPAEVARHCAPQVSVHQGPAALQSILPQSRLLIHHGGLGLCAAGLLAGAPQLLLPRHLEQELNTQNLGSVGCSAGLLVARAADPAAIRRIVEAMLDHETMQANALAAAASLRNGLIAEPEADVVAACRSMLSPRS